MEFAPVDFTREELADGLSRTGFDPAAPSVFSWLGVTMYLTEHEARATLDGIRRSAAPGSELVLDYPIPPERLTPEFRAIAERKNAELAGRGEPRISSYDPEAFEALLGELGFEVVENLASPDLDARLFASRADDLCANPENAIVQARRVG